MARAVLLLIAENELRLLSNRLERRRLRDASDPMTIPNRHFVNLFRLTKLSFLMLMDDLSPLLTISRRSTSIPNILKILAALHFYANGSYQRSAGGCSIFNMAQSTFSKVLTEVAVNPMSPIKAWLTWGTACGLVPLRMDIGDTTPCTTFVCAFCEIGLIVKYPDIFFIKVTNALNTREILLKYIQFPETQIERENVMRKFMEKFGFPGVIGCIDGTHIAIIQPHDDEECYLNRKHFHSLNLLIICDANLRILYANASFGGASHDSFVWNQCIIKEEMEQLHANGELCWLLGDSGYAQRPFLMTPILDAAPGSPEDHYTTLHCRARNTVERCIGVLKGRWRCLLQHRVLHYAPLKAARIVNACLVLHNIASARDLPMPDVVDFDSRHPELLMAVEQRPDTIRERLVERLWRERGLRA